MFDTLKLTLEELSSVFSRSRELALAGVEQNYKAVSYRQCGDGSCSNTCDGGCSGNSTCWLLL